MNKDVSDGTTTSSSSSGSYCTALSDEAGDDDLSCSTIADYDEPLVGSWSWDHSLADSERKMELHLIGDDLVLAVVMNQV